MECINFISRITKIPQQNFSISGTKDRRAIATQRVAVHKVTPARLAGLNSSLHGAKIGDFVMQKQKLNLGDLRGNHFRVALRDLQGDRAEIDSAVSEVAKRGFINYFGSVKPGILT
jgi:tRNA pseudouridine13 synthase